MKHIEIKSIEYNGIKISVKINYDKGEVSIVDRKNPFSCSTRDWSDKHFIFSGRGLNYMKGWLLILDAIKNAITEAKKDLEAGLAEKYRKSKLKTEKIVKILEHDYDKDDADYHENKDL